MAPAEDPRAQRASPQIVGLGTDLDTSSGGERAPSLQAIPTAHLTFIVDCARGKQLSLAAPSVPPPAPRPKLEPVTPPMKTYILFCGDSQPHLTQEASLGGGHLAQARGTLPPCRGTVAPASSPVSPRWPQEAPEAKGSPLKTVLTRSAWERVTGSLRAASSCVCGQAD
ncbi:PREDICTED: uncharacterized protein C1orf64 homolog [Miniopterus natalensis]|uniref:uncharacterized protein C1orf64 homolog n=1 Tax=Miniopterus natalensis TaxID=291302 RepID=UPI0007A72A4C|nr:PREDICTED: uncharacterized protein C1orf64 homolog [Miniopterus natalensis]